MKPFRICIRVKNNRLIKLREELGFSGKELAEKAGIHYSSYMDYENLKRSPISEQRPGEWKDVAVAIAEFHGVSPEWIWPDEIRAFRARALQLEATTQELVGLPPSPVAVFEQLELRRVLGRFAAERLTLKECNIVRERIVDDETKTFEEIGEEYEVGKERIRQIHDGALRKLRCLTGFGPVIGKARELIKLEAKERFRRDE